MIKPLITVLVVSATLSACATVRESRLNPLNWFGRDRSEPVEQIVEVVDRRPLMSQVLSVSVDPTPEGAILRAVGLPPTQGYWQADLIALEGDTPGSLVYEFRAVPPIEPSASGPQRSREVLVGTDISHADLRGISRIVVVGAQNRRIVSR